MKKQVTLTLLLILLMLVACAAGLFLIRPGVLDLQRKNAEAELLERIRGGVYAISGLSVPPVEGEEARFPELTDPESRETLYGCGSLEIEAIQLEMPLVRLTDTASLRAAAGWYPRSAEIGASGNCVIAGHSLRPYGRHFNRLGELKAGDHILLYNREGACFRYSVTGSEVVKPEELPGSIARRQEGCNLTLVTYTPTGSGTHRLLVYGELDTSVG